MIEQHPNDDAAVHHEALVAIGHEERGDNLSRFEIADCNGGGGDLANPGWRPVGL